MSGLRVIRYIRKIIVIVIKVQFGLNISNVQFLNESKIIVIYITFMYCLCLLPGFAGDFRVRLRLGLG